MNLEEEINESEKEKTVLNYFLKTYFSYHKKVLKDYVTAIVMQLYKIFQNISVMFFICYLLNISVITFAIIFICIEFFAYLYLKLRKKLKRKKS